MNRWIATAAMLLIVRPVLAVDGEPGMHDPSTVMQARRRVLRLWHGRRPAVIRLRRRMDLASRRSGDAACQVAVPVPRCSLKGGNNTWAPGHHPERRPLLPLLLGPRDAAEVRDRPAGRKTLDPASPDYKWEDA